MTVTHPTIDTVELRSGQFLDLRELDHTVISLRDIAHGLSLTCRFGGQCSHYYSVAEHALLVADRLVSLGHPLDVVLEGLHHDDSESIITDVPRPAKSMLPDYKILESRVQAACMAAAGVESVDHEAVKSADDWALAQEAGELMPSKGRHWTIGHTWDGTRRRLGMDPALAEARWIEMHYRLSIRLDRARASDAGQLSS